MSGSGVLSKKVFIKTWGCQMNVYDSTRMRDALECDGYTPTTDLSDADLVLLNTCHIREKAAEKVYSSLGKVRKLKDLRKDTDRPLLVGVTGCVAQAEGEQIIERARCVDMVIGPQSYHNLPSIIRRAQTGEPQIVTDFAVDDKFAQPLATDSQVRSQGVAAFLTVQEGCDKFCTFCVVPYTRGAEVSRPREQILEQARSLASSGVREITLLGQNVNAWHGTNAQGSDIGLGELLRELSDIEGVARWRYVTSHPHDMDEGLICAHRDLPTLMPYLHLPVQSGSDRILKSMNRRHTSQSYLDIIERVRQARSDIALSGDFIVGFPGETEDDFTQTLDLVSQVEYAQCFSFKYSMRPGTPGALMEDQIPDDIKKERLSRLQSLLSEQQQNFNSSCVGKTIPVLLEKDGKQEDQWIGRSQWLQSVIVPRRLGERGDIVDVKITQAHQNSLVGDYIH